MAQPPLNANAPTPLAAGQRQRRHGGEMIGTGHSVRDSRHQTCQRGNHLRGCLPWARIRSLFRADAPSVNVESRPPAPERAIGSGWRRQRAPEDKLSEPTPITHKFEFCRAASFPFIPTGLRPPAQGWPSATAVGLPWVLGPALKQPQRGCAQIADDWRNTFGVENAF
ncbi:MAG: hypothetical protein ACI8QF_003615 [Limisphaerales bacterium]|jgi:hypothetical protein